MEKITLVPDHFCNCPICGKECIRDEAEGYNTPAYAQGKCDVFLCINPLAKLPLHYYTHVVDKTTPNIISYQEFTIDIGNKYVVFALDLVGQKTIIKDSKRDKGLELNLIISPDFPKLSSLVKKIRTAITFS